MKCLIVQPIHAAGLARLREAGIEPVLCPDRASPTIAAYIPDCQAVITRDAGLDAAGFAAADALRAVIVHGAGHDPVDKPAAKARNVIIATTPGANARSVAELALGLTLALARGIPAADATLRGGQAGFRESRNFIELAGKTALIVGWGHTGRQFGAMLAALGLHLLVFSPRVATIDGHERAASLAAGLARADLVSLHTPLRPETQGLMNEAAFAAMKPGALLINLARAGLIDETALTAALQSGHLGGAALDVYSPGAPQGPLGACGNVIFTPHLGGTTQDALRRTALAAAEHVISALTGTMPPTTINPDAWTPRP
nr:NAD(P)-dependent oxidoreductase [uncultured Acidocella sp.]